MWWIFDFYVLCSIFFLFVYVMMFFVCTTTEVGTHVVHVTHNESGKDVGTSPYTVLVENDTLSKDQYGMEAFKVFYPDKGSNSRSWINFWC